MATTNGQNGLHRIIDHLHRIIDHKMWPKLAAQAGMMRSHCPKGGIAGIETSSWAR